MTTSIKEKVDIKILMYILIAVIVFFTTGDLISGATNQLPIALTFSSLSGLAVFIGAFLKNKIEYEEKADDTIKFIKSNFNWSSILLSVLDILCSIIALLTTIFWLGLIFRSIFIGRLIIKFYKYKTIVRAVIVASFIYITRRSNKMTKSTVLQKILTSILAIFGVSGIVAMAFPTFLPIAQNITQVVGIVSESIAILSGIWLAGTSDKVLSDEEIAKLNAEKEQKEIAKKQKEVAKAKAELERIEQLKKIVAEAEQNK